MDDLRLGLRDPDGNRLVQCKSPLSGRSAADAVLSGPVWGSSGAGGGVWYAGMAGAACMGLTT
jgi:hypothetical protein